MPFLEHLEELRFRLLRSLLAIAVGFGLGLWLVQRFQLVTLLKEPIAPYLENTGGKLAALSPTEPFMIVLKLGFVVGLVLASPVIIYQIWAFLSPALYERERRTVIPALLAGTVLFMLGGALGYVFLVPQALRVLLSFQSEALALVITYNEYFGFVLQIVLALGISFELPLVIIVLSILGVISPAGLNRFRRFAIVLACIGGAILSPGTDVLSMIMMTIPLIILYEIGFLGSWLVQRRRRREATASAALLAALLFGAGGRLQAQEPTLRKPALKDTLVPRPEDSLTVSRDSARLKAGQALDTAAARRLGIPTAPTRSFAQPDSILQELLARPGYQATRYRSDSATLTAEDRRILLQGEAMTQRRGTTLEADSITYQESNCILRAAGDPHLFDGENVVVGDGIRYNSCSRRGIVADAFTNFNQEGTVWFLRGNIAQDSSASRIYAASSEITSCDLPVPHYHFSAHEVKWISKNVMVARPAVLYIRDVPVLWLPFVFQDARPGRRSGILIPQFGLNDIVRPTPGYNRQVTNIGYYWAPSDYFDATARLDWFANRYTQYGVSGQYRWLDRFLQGSLAFNRQKESGGSSSTQVRWDHRQSFNLTTTLNLNLDYVSNSSIVSRNAIDPILSTQQVSSSANFSKRYPWGTITIGGTRRQNLSDKSVTQQLPALTISPKPLDLSQSITWSPALSLTNDLGSNVSGQNLLVSRVGGIDTVRVTQDTRVTAMNLDTPLRFGGFNWRNSISVVDNQRTGRQAGSSITVPDTTTPDPTDSVRVSTVFAGDFSTGINWETGINLPTLFRGSWKLQPALGIANATSQGPFLLRNRNTNGDFVRQGKRFSLSLTSSPTFFAFFPGFGPLGRIRHSFSPILAYNYSPAASIPLEYARALAQPGQPLTLRSDPTQTVSLGLSQNFEGKARPKPGDTTSAESIRKFRILSIATSPIAYDFEQAKLPGRTGWRTPSISNSFQSDLLPGFNLTLTHDLWRGTVGTDSAKFDPFLQSVNASFAISGGTVRSLLSAFGLGGKQEGQPTREEPPPPSYVAGQSRRTRPGSFYSSEQISPRGSNRFTANFNYSLSRTRPIPGAATPGPPSRQNLGFSTSFSPTAFWNVSWSAQYNITDAKFESQVIRLERDLHEWRAGFSFTRNANGNFAFFFSVYLSDLPEIKFDYNQTTIER